VVEEHERQEHVYLAVDNLPYSIVPHADYRNLSSAFLKSYWTMRSAMLLSDVDWHSR
jgi:hypothetical protein